MHPIVVCVLHGLLRCVSVTCYLSYHRRNNRSGSSVSPRRYILKPICLIVSWKDSLQSTGYELLLSSLLAFLLLPRIAYRRISGGIVRGC